MVDLNVAPEKRRSDGFTQSFMHPFSSSLVQRITASVFLAIIAIEIIILVPSYLRLEEQILNRLSQTGLEHAQTMIRALEKSNSLDADFKKYAYSLFALPSIKGLAFYLKNRNGKCLVGELPSSSYAAGTHSQKPNYLKRFGRIEVVVATTLGGHEGNFILRLDASHVPNELKNFVIRIFGLVMVISLFVTLITMLVLNKLIVAPILNLRNSLLYEGANAWSVELSWRGLALQNEIGELYRAINSRLVAQRQATSRLIELDSNHKKNISNLMK